jgi:hypothetical protein
MKLKAALRTPATCSFCGKPDQTGTCSRCGTSIPCREEEREDRHSFRYVEGQRADGLGECESRTEKELQRAVRKVRTNRIVNVYRDRKRKSNKEDM